MFLFPDLSPRTRELMLEELAHDLASGTLYLSRRLTGQGRLDYPKHLEEAARSGDASTLADRLRQPGQLHTVEERAMRPVRVPHTAPETLAEGEFNRFYARALCRRAIEEGLDEVTVFRARQVREPRPRSMQMIGRAMDPHRLLADLRAHPGMDTALGLPPGPNSGLSIRLPDTAAHRVP